jgi:hypothetical protein
MSAVYDVAYIEHYAGEPKRVQVIANNKENAYSKAVYETLGAPPYSAWVEGVTYKNGNYKTFNTFSGKPY